MSTGNDLVTAPIHKQLAGIANGGIPSLIPQTIDEVWRFSQLLANSGLTPKGIDTPEKVTVQILMGFDLGLKPMQSVQNINVINGKPSIGGDLALAILMTSGQLVDHDEWIEGEGDQRVGVCRVERKGMKPIERRFSVEEAKRAGLWQTEPMIRKSYWDKNTKQRVQSRFEEPNDSPWYKYQPRMLCMRARGFAFRDRFSDVLKGMHLTEEMMGHEEESQAPVEQVAGPGAPVPQASISAPLPPQPAATHSPQTVREAMDQMIEEGEIVEAPSPAEGGGKSAPEKPAEPEHPAHAQEEPFDVEAWLEEAQGLFHSAKTLSDVDDVHAIFEETATELPAIERQRYEDMHGGAMQRIEDAIRQAAEAQQDAENTGEADAAAAPLPVDASESQDDDVTLEADDDEQADAAGPNRGEIYVAKIRAMIADPEITFPVVGKLWNDTKAERSEMMADGLISKETRNELLSELDARKKAEAPAQAQQDGPGAPPPPAADGPGAPPPPANDHADEDPITKLDREFRAQLEACSDKVAVAALAAETLVARNKFSGTPQHKAWSDLVATKRKSFAGVA